MLGSSPGCWPEVASGHGAAEATGGRWKREGDGSHALEWDSKTVAASGYDRKWQRQQSAVTRNFKVAERDYRTES